MLDSAIVYDAIRGNVDGDLYRAGESGSFVEAAGREPGRLRIGWSTTAVTPGVRPDPEHVRAVQDAASQLASLGHRVEEVDPGYPDPTAAFVPQFFGGVRTEVDAVEHPERLERRTREVARLGAWARRPVLEWALRQLSPENRAVLTLVHLDGYSVREAAQLLGWSLVNVKVRAHRARQALRALLRHTHTESAHDGP